MIKYLNEEQGEHWDIVCTGGKVYRVGPIINRWSRSFEVWCNKK